MRLLAFTASAVESDVAARVRAGLQARIRLVDALAKYRLEARSHARLLEPCATTRLPADATGLIVVVPMALAL